MKLAIILIAAALAGCATVPQSPQSRAETAEAWEAIDRMIEQRRANKERRAMKVCTWQRSGADWIQVCF